MRFARKANIALANQVHGVLKTATYNISHLLAVKDRYDTLRADHGSLMPGLGADHVVVLVLLQVVPRVPGPNVSVSVGVLGNLGCYAVYHGDALLLEVFGNPGLAALLPLPSPRALGLLQLETTLFTNIVTHFKLGVN